MVRLGIRSVSRSGRWIAWAALSIAASSSWAQTLEGALGVQVSSDLSPPPGHGHGVALSPVGYLTWGRWSLSSGAGLIERKRDGTDGGLTAEIRRRGTMTTRLGFRLDRGRDASSDPILTGMGDISPTIRARLDLQWRPSDVWTVSTGLSADALGRGHGVMGDLSATRNWPMGQGRLSLGASLAWADTAYTQRWYGVSSAQAITSGHPTFLAQGGLRGVDLSLGWQRDLNLNGQVWATFAGLSWHRHLGDALRSPLTVQQDQWSARLGTAWRF
jgi:outer membrane scaffolding protein for murein synthesis (MipA/OmpV family)